ncbi:hypothetical protein PR048_017101 [Dryococelus australis]|uniref:Uncharacterized protein n=1 Tax=Dryococelus australis TaxID=614101 RepID=A0ABQ9H8N9_9NEOP|nr:hypothetical protein PR048_017101 [Dryococelus australis]
MKTLIPLNCPKQKRRGTSRISVDVNFDENMLATVQQENSHANEKKKTKLIGLLVETLTARGIEAITATGNADGSIVRCGLNKVTSHSSVVVSGEDVDLLKLPFSGSILPMHSFTGRDTTCAIFNKSKLSILKCFLKLPNETKAIADIVYDPTSTPDAVAQAGEEMFRTMYQAQPNEGDLNNHRYNSFVKYSTKVKANLASLPPTIGAAK